VQGTQGADLLPELDVDRLDHIVEKGQDKRVEMYSAFADPFKNPCVINSGLVDILRKADITDVYVVGLAADYCVKHTAIDSQKEGFKTWVIGEATKAVDPSAMDQVHKAYEKVGVTVVGKDDAQVLKVKDYVQRTQDQAAKDADKAGESVLD
jgi:nicotinamidase-related amidase